MPLSAQNTAVVIPTFQERDNIPKLVATLFSLYPGIHVLIVDDHSPDGTAEAVRALQPAYPNLMLLERLHNRGFAASYRDGFQHVLAQPWCHAVVMMDADFSHDPRVIGHLLDHLAAYDVVVGSRYVSGGTVRNWNRRRRMLSRAANSYVRQVLAMPVRDITSGYMGLRRQALERVPSLNTGTRGYGFLIELKCLLHRSGSRMVEHPISFDERREGQSKMSAASIWESIWLPWRIRRRS